MSSVFNDRFFLKFNSQSAAYWTVYYILANPDAKTAVMKELAEAFGDRLSRVDFNIEFDDLSKLQVVRLRRALHLKIFNFFLSAL